MGRPFTKAQREAAKSLAVAYEAYNEAKRDRIPNAIRVWGRALIDAQELTGVVLMTPESVEARIRRALTEGAA